MATSRRRAALDAWLVEAEQILEYGEGHVPDDSGEDVPFETGDAA
jgi:hypothetical protein